MKRKFILFLLVLVMIFTLVSCPKEPEPVIPPVDNNGTNSGGTPPEVIPPGGDGTITPEGLVPLPTNVLYVFDEEKNPSYSSSTVALNTIFNPDELGQMVLVFDRSEWVKHLEYCLADITHEESVVARGFYFTKDGKEWFFNDIGFRIRGNTSRISPQEIWFDEETETLKYGKYQQAHFALDFEEWVEDDEDKKLADSMKGLILKRFKDDFTYSREIFAYNFFRNNGVWLAPRAAYTTLKIQIVDDMDLDGDGDVTEFETIDYGVYGMIEEVKKQFLKERTTKQGGGELQSQKGNLWKCTHPSNFLLADVEGKIGEEEFSFVKDEEENIIGSNKVTYPYDYKGDNELAEGKEQLLTFMKDLNNLPDCTDSDNDEADIETIKAFYTDRMDGDLFLKTYAINIILGMWDDYWINSNNFYFYFDTNGKAYFIPYDYDNSLGTNGGKTDCANQDPLNWGEFSDGPKPLIEKILQVPEYQDTFKKYLDEFSNEDSLFDDDKSIAQITGWQNMIKDFIGSKDLKYNDTTPTFQDKVASWGKPYCPYTLYTPGDMNYFTVRQRSIQNYLYPSDGKKTLTINAGKGFLYNGDDKTNTLPFEFEPGTRFDEITKDIDYLPVYSDEIQKWYSYEEDGVYYVATALMDSYGNTFSFNDNRVLWDDATYEVYYSHYVPITLNFNGGTWWDEEKQETITDFIVKYYLADEWFSPNIWPEKEDCYFKEWIFEDGSKIEYVPSEATTVYAKWGPRSDFYDYLANGDIIGDFDGNGVSLIYKGEGKYSYTFTYDSTTMNQWFGGSDNYPATDENGGIVEFKIRPNKAWDGTQIGIQYNDWQPEINGGHPYCLVGGENIVVHGLQEGCTYTIYYQVNDAYGGWVWIETSDIPSSGEPDIMEPKE